MPKRKRNPVVIPQSVEIKAMSDHIVAVIWLGDSSIGLRFLSPEHLLEFFQDLMKAACKVWPENEWIQEYLREE